MAKKNFKTNAMRIIEEENLEYSHYTYKADKDHVDGVTAAKMIGKPVEQVFKTLVTKGHSGEYFVFVIPVEETLDMKKAARACKEKSVEMIQVKDINKITGYIRGGCSPIGMKKQYGTFFDSTVENHETVVVSAGKIGHQVELSPKDLVRIVNGTVVDLTLGK